MTDNERRSERAYRTVLIYRQQAGDDAPLRDLLTDLMHWADEYGEDWDAEHAAARMHYSAERES